MNIIFLWFACVWKSENIVVTLLKSMSLSVVNRSQLVRKWTSSSRISHLGHSLSVMGVRGRVCLPLLYGPPGTFSTILIGPNGTKCVMNLSRSLLGRFTRLKVMWKPSDFIYALWNLLRPSTSGGPNDHGAQYIQRSLDQFSRFKSYMKWCTLTRSIPLDDWKAIWKSLSCRYRLASSFPRVSELS